MQVIVAFLSPAKRQVSSLNPATTLHPLMGGEKTIVTFAILFCHQIATHLFKFFSPIKILIMNEIKWVTKKPKFNKECLLLTATWMNYHEPHYWDYSLFTIAQADGEDNEGNLGWYWGIFKDDDEWGDIDDLTADKYAVLPLLKNKLKNL